ncbi:MAG: metallophosphoesterase [Pirellulaceae bacterium]
MRIVWTTDPHLNHVPLQAWDHWVAAIAAQAPDAVLVTGDISEGDDVVFQLRRMVETFGVPLYFVLGNHDFYQSSIEQTRQRVTVAADQHPLLNFLTGASPIRLGNGVYLMGEDGWGDAAQGDYEGSPVRLNDFRLIEDFASADPATWKYMLLDQGKQSADRLQKQLQSVPSEASELIIATHVPPFCEACWYEGHTTDQNWAPFFVCGQAGDVLKRFADENATINLHVLCGHTHHDGIAKLADNLTVYTGAAIYGQPDIEANLEINAKTCTVDLLR